MPDEVTIQGTIERVVHRTQEGWVVARMATSTDEGTVSVVGRFAGADEGATLRVTGQWESHPRFGRQFRAKWSIPVRPETGEAIERFLSSGLVEGIGKVMARRLVAEFGNETLEVIDKHPSRLTDVDGIGKGRAANIQRAWSKHQSIREVMFFLQGHGIGGVHAHRILETLGDEAVPTITRNPFVLAERVRGIGFLSADRIARRLGFDADHPARVEAGLLHVLDAATNDGHCALPKEELHRRTETLLEPDGGTSALTEVAESALARLTLGGRVIEDAGDEAAADWIYPSRLYEAERRVAESLRALACAQQVLPGGPQEFDAAGAVRWVSKLLHMELAQGQQQAVTATLRNRLVVVTGGPGTGKTTVVQAIVQVHKRAGRQVLLAAPTGRAAHRLQEATGEKASTLHRLLEYSPGENRFQRNADKPLRADVVIVDETSMVDIVLMDHLLQALVPGTTLVLVGDADQLPSVGPGHVLGDVIASGVPEVVTLGYLFRQEAGSLIVENAHRILQGEMPHLPPPGDSSADFYFFERDEPEEVLSTIVELCAERIPRGFGYDPVEDVQVLTPMHRGIVGAQQLNAALQEALNPAPGGAVAGGRGFRPGDKVMQVRNDYDLDVFNGDIGRVTSVDPASGRMTVVLDGRTVVYEGRQADNLQPAYAVSIHKSQGSEYPAVVVPVHTQHWIMLRRDLLYTAVTRGKRLVILVGSRKALSRAVRNAQTTRRYTRLHRRLRRTRTR